VKIDAVDVKLFVIQKPVHKHAQDRVFILWNTAILFRNQDITNIAAQLKQAIDSGTASNIPIRTKTADQTAENNISFTVE
jgi:hypothetical protein